MATEIERKFLVVGDAWRAGVRRSVAMRQGYLAAGSDTVSVRVRLENEDATLNIKAAVVGRSRAEYEYRIPSADARELLATLCAGVIEKTRHFVSHEGRTWEVDVFAGANAGLVVAEIELEHPDQDFSRPVWLGAEVTEDRRYYNHDLARRPYSTWTSR